MEPSQGFDAGPNPVKSISSRSVIGKSFEAFKDIKVKSNIRRYLKKRVQIPSGALCSHRLMADLSPDTGNTEVRLFVGALPFVPDWRRGGL
jgi:hypothetical protein